MVLFYKSLVHLKIIVQVVSYTIYTICNWKRFCWASTLKYGKCLKTTNSLHKNDKLKMVASSLDIITVIITVILVLECPRKYLFTRNICLQITEAYILDMIDSIQLLKSLDYSLTLLSLTCISNKVNGCFYFPSIPLLWEGIL